MKAAGSFERAAAAARQTNPIASQALSLARYAQATGDGASEVAPLLREVLQSLTLPPHDLHRSGERLAEIGKFQFYGVQVPGYREAAEEFFAALQGGGWVRESRPVRILAALGRWEEAFEMLATVQPPSDGAFFREGGLDRLSTACTFLLVAPEEVLGAQAEKFAEHMELAWHFTAALELRASPRGIIGRLSNLLPGTSSSYRQLLGESASLLGFDERF